MQATKGYYCLIQYCPDFGRLEAANVGVLLFCPEAQFLKAITTRNNKRVRRFFGTHGHDWDKLNLFKQGLMDRLTSECQEIKSIEQLEHFIATRANNLQLTPPRPVKISNPEQDLKELFAELCSGNAAAKEPKRSFKKALADKLEKPEITNKIKKDIKVNVPVFQRELEIPYGFQNGRFNLIKPVNFLSANKEQSLYTACKYAVEGRSLFDTPDPIYGKLQLLIVGRFPSKEPVFVENVRRVLEKNEVTLYRMSELPRLVTEIQLHGKPIDNF